MAVVPREEVTVWTALPGDRERRGEHSPHYWCPWREGDSMHDTVVSWERRGHRHHY